MPTSGWHYITPILTEIQTHHTARPIRNMLDIGVGAGKWGFLVRDTLDHYTNSAFFKSDWKVRVEGIEGFERYRTPLHDYVYDKIHWGNVLDLVDSLPNYDLITFIEVIEHIDKERGLELLSKLMERCRRLLILTFPPEVDSLGRHVLEQGATHGNKLEEHVSIWNESDLKGYAFRKIAEQTYVLSPSEMTPRIHAEQSVLIKDDGTRVLTLEESVLEYEIPEQARELHLAVLKHPWSGNLRVSDRHGNVIREEDLFSEKSSIETLELKLDSVHSPLRLQVLPNPRSNGREAWIKHVAVY